MIDDMSRQTILRATASLGLANGTVGDQLASAATSPPQQNLAVRVLETQSPMPLALRVLITSKG